MTKIVEKLLRQQDHLRDGITAKELKTLENEFGRLNIETSRSVLEFYQSRKNVDDVDSGPQRQPTRIAS